MADQPTCVGCGESATGEVTIPACEACLTLLQASLASLQPSSWGEGADQYTPARRGALVRARWVALQAARTVDALANERLGDAELKEAIAKMDQMFATMHGHEASFCIAMGVVDQMDVAAELVKLGVPFEDSTRHVIRQLGEVWPEVGARIPVDCFNAAVRDRATGNGEGKWKSAHAVLEKAGLRRRYVGKDAGGTLPWETLRTEHHRWRHAGGRVLAQQLRELREHAAGP